MKDTGTTSGSTPPSRNRRAVLPLTIFVTISSLVILAFVMAAARPVSDPPDEGVQATPAPQQTQESSREAFVRLDAGADLVSVDADGRTWQPDDGFVGDPANAVSTSGEIVGTNDTAIFETARVDPIAYSFSLPNGCYQVTTHHAEIDPDIDVGDRQMGVWAEGDVAIVDVAAEVGSMTTYSQLFRQVDVADGSLDVRFAGLGPQPPAVAGIEVHSDTGCDAAAAGQKAAVDVKRLVENAVAAGLEYVRIPPGEHRISETIVVDDGGGIVIDATDATLVFTCGRTPPDGCSAFRFIGQGATLRGATIDFDPLPFTQGVITAKSGTSVTVALDAGYPNVDWFVRTSAQHQLHFDERGQWKVPAMPFASVARGSDSRTAVLSVQPTQAGDLAVGDRMVLTARGGANAVEMLFGDGDVRLEQVTILSATGLAVYAQHWSGTATLAFPTIKPGPRPAGADKDRLISTNQDALRWVVSRAGPTVYGANISRQGDDGINFQGYPYAVEAVESATSVVLRPVQRWVSPDEIFTPGDRLRVMDMPGAIVRAVQEIRDVEELPTPDGRPVFRLTLAGPIDVSVGQIADIPEHNSPDAVVRSSWFHDHVANGMRVKGSGWTVEGNAFDRLVAGNGVLVSPDYEAPGWRESGWVDGLMVARNVFRDIGSSEVHAAVAVSETDSTFDGHRDITIVDNTIDGVSGYGISVRNTVDAIVAGNRIAGSALEPIDADASNSSVVVEP